MTNKVYNWGILAPGKIARKFATELQQLDNACVYAIGSTDEKRAKAFADEFGAPRHYGNYTDLAADPDVDIIYIASPHAFHAEQALLCLNHRKPVLCEKALSLNAKEVAGMLECARGNRVFMMEAMMVPHQPSYQQAKRIIDSGELGKVKGIHAHYGFNKSPYDLTQRLMNPALGGGALLDIGLYPIFDTLYFLGEPEHITAQAELAETGIDQSISVRFDYPNGLSASIFASFVTAAGLGTTIFCEYGTLRLRRLSSTDQWLEVEKPSGEPLQLTWTEKQCGLKLEAAEAMKCMDKNLIESPVMPHSLSLTLMKTLDIIRQRCGIIYPGRD